MGYCCSGKRHWGGWRLMGVGGEGVLPGDPRSLGKLDGWHLRQSSWRASNGERSYATPSTGLESGGTPKAPGISQTPALDDRPPPRTPASGLKPSATPLLLALCRRHVPASHVCGACRHPGQELHPQLQGAVCLQRWVQAESGDIQPDGVRVQRDHERGPLDHSQPQVHQ